MLFIPGKVYNRKQDIHDVYGGQAQSGISTPSAHPVVFLFTGESGVQYGYRDEFHPDGTFWYTGEGRVGPMEMVRGNRAIRDHQKTGKALHLFEYVDTGKVSYIGEARYLSHHTEERPDQNGDLRPAFIFELEVDSAPSSPSATSEVEEPINVGGLWKRPLEELRQIALLRPSQSTESKERRVMTRFRSEAVKVYVRRRANGVCEVCGREAPFFTKDGRPYLEPHHIRRMSIGANEKGYHFDR